MTPWWYLMERLAVPAVTPISPYLITTSTGNFCNIGANTPSHLRQQIGGPHGGRISCSRLSVPLFWQPGW